MPITMSDLNKRISALEGVTPKTPITMKSLSDRLANLEATAKKWEIVNSNVVPSHLDSYNWVVISCTLKVTDANVRASITETTYSLYSSNHPGSRGSEGSFVKSGGKIIAQGSSSVSVTVNKVLYYK